MALTNLKGVAQMTYREYEKSPGIRQSRLKVMAKTPAHFRAAMEAEDEETRATKLGHIFHTAVLEPNLLAMSHYVRPLTYTDRNGVAKKWNGNANECKEWLAAHSDRIVIFDSELADIVAMKKSVMEHPRIREAIEKGTSEMCIFWQDDTTGIGCKARLDLPCGNTIIDLKTTEDASKEGFAKAIGNYGYDVQAAYNLDGANKLGLKKEYFLFAAVEKTPPYACALHELDAESIQIGRQKYRRWLDLLSHCMEFDDWPGYDPAINLIRLREWEIRAEQNFLLNG